MDDPARVRKFDCGGDSVKKKHAVGYAQGAAEKALSKVHG